MGGADIGGDESVQWLVEVDHVRFSTLKQEPIGDTGWRHAGVDEADEGDFTISIKVPNDDPRFLARLRAAVERAEKIAGAEKYRESMVTFTLPIVRGDHSQIQIRWKSKPLVKGTKRRSRSKR
jgi:hypothetical protein